jgi:hypothetical protein
LFIIVDGASVSPEDDSLIYVAADILAAAGFHFLADWLHEVRQVPALQFAEALSVPGR